jgi:hypothetical protein
MRHLYGHRGYAAAGSQRIPDDRVAPAGSSASRQAAELSRHAINEALRDWVTNVGKHTLSARLGAGAASLSDDGA